MQAARCCAGHNIAASRAPAQGALRARRPVQEDARGGARAATAAGAGARGAGDGRRWSAQGERPGRHPPRLPPPRVPRGRRDGAPWWLAPVSACAWAGGGASRRARDGGGEHQGEQPVPGGRGAARPGVLCLLRRGSGGALPRRRGRRQRQDAERDHHLHRAQRGGDCRRALGCGYRGRGRSDRGTRPRLRGRRWCAAACPLRRCPGRGACNALGCALAGRLPWHAAEVRSACLCRWALLLQASAGPHARVPRRW
eukprot:scaffold663_cov358-Prasinococcus_capsulatus_cf.AAC.8